MKRIIFLMLLLGFSSSLFGASVYFDYPDHGSVHYSDSEGYGSIDYRLHTPGDFYWDIGDFQTRIQNADGTWGPWLVGQTGTWELTKARSYKYQGRVWVKWDAQFNSNYWIYTHNDLTLHFVDTTPPAKPQSINSTSANNHPKITWDTNTEEDFSHYNIYKKETTNGNWQFLATTSNNYFVDETEEIITGPTQAFEQVVYYKTNAIDINDNSSSFSDEVSVRTKGEPLNKKSIKEDVKLVSFELLANYPNPFNPTTQISYQIQKNSFVNLVVYNALGQEVAVLVNQHLSSGKYSIQFDASSASGGLPSGVYIYKLQAGEFSSVKKMLLTK